MHKARKIAANTAVARNKQAESIRDVFREMSLDGYYVKGETVQEQQDYNKELSGIIRKYGYNEKGEYDLDLALSNIDKAAEEIKKLDKPQSYKIIPSTLSIAGRGLGWETDKVKYGESYVYQMQADGRYAFRYSGTGGQVKMLDYIDSGEIGWNENEYGFLTFNVDESKSDYFTQASGRLFQDYKVGVETSSTSTTNRAGISTNTTFSFKYANGIVDTVSEAQAELFNYISPTTSDIMIEPEFWTDDSKDFLAKMDKSFDDSLIKVGIKKLKRKEKNWFKRLGDAFVDFVVSFIEAVAKLMEIDAVKIILIIITLGAAYEAYLAAELVLAAGYGLMDAFIAFLYEMSFNMFGAMATNLMFEIGLVAAIAIGITATALTGFNIAAGFDLINHDTDFNALDLDQSTKSEEDYAKEYEINYNLAIINDSVDSGFRSLYTETYDYSSMYNRYG